MIYIYIYMYIYIYINVFPLGVFPCRGKLVIDEAMMRSLKQFYERSGTKR